MSIRVSAATGPDDIAAARTLFLEYAESLDFNLCFQGFDAEMARFPGEYAPPGGTLLLARDGDAVVGCVALRPAPDGFGEMKRLYLRPAARGTGAGRALAVAVIEVARALGKKGVLLDTATSMVAAASLYRDLGFRQVDGPPGGAGEPELLYFRLEFPG
ncbi:MAG: GNAT family N-acetyltransferase [Pseudomonadota bacterium]|nr:GNAT family N-acetyltransferase [Pseudomonadota bacterium]